MLAHDFPFDTVQMPLNCFDATFRSFEQHVLPELNRRGIAPLGMKSFGGSGEMVRHGDVRPDEALRYAMSLPVAVTISGDGIDAGFAAEPGGRVRIPAARRRTRCSVFATAAARALGWPLRAYSKRP